MNDPANHESIIQTRAQFRQQNNDLHDGIAHMGNGANMYYSQSISHNTRSKQLDGGDHHYRQSWQKKSGQAAQNKQHPAYYQQENVQISLNKSQLNRCHSNRSYSQDGAVMSQKKQSQSYNHHHRMSNQRDQR